MFMNACAARDGDCPTLCDAGGVQGRWHLEQEGGRVRQHCLGGDEGAAALSVMM